MTILFSAGAFYAVTREELKTLRSNVVEIKATLRTQTETINQLAVQKTQIENQAGQIVAILQAQRITEQRIYDLSRGRGFIKSDRESIEGEHP